MLHILHISVAQTPFLIPARWPISKLKFFFFFFYFIIYMNGRANDCLYYILRIIIAILLSADI